MSKTPTTRCLYCSRFVRVGVTRCARCDEKASLARLATLARAPRTVTADTEGFATFASPSAAYLRVRCWVPRVVLTLCAALVALACS